MFAFACMLSRVRMFYPHVAVTLSLPRCPCNRWHLMAHPLAARLAFFERHWAFFGGFGSVCAVAAVSPPQCSDIDVSQRVRHQQSQTSIPLPQANHSLTRPATACCRPAA
jgi:hypothetical protein